MTGIDSQHLIGVIALYFIKKKMWYDCQCDTSPQETE